MCHYKAIVFDLDGTLYSTRPLKWRVAVSSLLSGNLNLLRAERKARKQLAGLQNATKDAAELDCLKVMEGLTEEGLGEQLNEGLSVGSQDSLRGKAYQELFNRMAMIAKTSPQIAEKWFMEWYMPLQVKILKKNCHCRKGLHEHLLKLRQSGVKTAVLSDYGFVREKLASLGLSADEFDMIFQSMQFGALKPHPECFRGACDSLGILPEEALMVGDREDTDGGAVAIGMKYKNIQYFANLD